MGDVTFTQNEVCEEEGKLRSKVDVENFAELKHQILLDIKAVVEIEDIPAELISNWDYTAISVVQVSSWTMEMKGAKRVQIAGISDKRQITAVFCATLAVELLLFQLLYQGKMTACLPEYKYPGDWHVTFTHLITGQMRIK